MNNLEFLNKLEEDNKNIYEMKKTINHLYGVMDSIRESKEYVKGRNILYTIQNNIRIFKNYSYYIIILFLIFYFFVEWLLFAFCFCVIVVGLYFLICNLIILNISSVRFYKKSLVDLNIISNKLEILEKELNQKEYENHIFLVDHLTIAVHNAGLITLNDLYFDFTDTLVEAHVIANILQNEITKGVLQKMKISNGEIDILYKSLINKKDIKKVYMNFD